MLNATFNNILVISWRSVLLMEESEVPRENHPSATDTDKLYHIILYWVNLAWAGLIRTHNVRGDMHWWHKYLKPNYHMSTTTDPPPTPNVLQSPPMTWLTIMQHLYKWPWTCYVCRNHDSVPIITGFSKRGVTLVEQELLTLREYMRSPPECSWGSCCSIFSFLCIVL